MEGTSTATAALNCHSCFNEVGNDKPGFDVRSVGRLTIQECGELVSLTLTGVHSDRPIGAWIQEALILPHEGVDFSQLPTKKLVRALSDCFAALTTHLQVDKLSVYERLRPLGWLVLQLPTWSQFPRVTGEKKCEHVEQCIGLRIPRWVKELKRAYDKLLPLIILSKDNAKIVYEFARLQKVGQGSAGIKTIHCLFIPSTGQIVEVWDRPLQDNPSSDLWYTNYRTWHTQNGRQRFKPEHPFLLGGNRIEIGEPHRSILKLTRFLLARIAGFTWIKAIQENPSGYFQNYEQAVKDKFIAKEIYLRVGCNWSVSAFLIEDEQVTKEDSEEG